MKKILNNKEHKNFLAKIKNFYFLVVNNIQLKFSILYLLFLFFSITPLLKYSHLISGIWVCRDVFLFIGILLIFNFSRNINLKKKILIFGLIIFYNMIFLSVNLNSIVKKDENNFILNRVENSELINSLSKLQKNKKNYYRVYLSKGLYPFILKGYENDGIFSNTDLIKYNIAPFNGHFKNNTIIGFDEKYLLNGWIDSHYDLIENEFFLDLFRIKYLLITEKELRNLQNKNFNFVSKIQTNKVINQKEIKTLTSIGIQVENKFEKEKIIIFERKISNFALNNNNYKKLKKIVSNCKLEILSCILTNKKLFEKSKHKIERLDNAKFLIKDYSINTYIFLPFLYDKNWKTSLGKIEDINNYGMFFSSDETKLKKEFFIYYHDQIRIILKFIVIISLIIYIIIYFFLKKKFFKSFF